MKTKDELEIEFRKDFEELLEKYKAELFVTDDGSSDGSRIGFAVITIMSNYSSDGELLNEYCEFCL
jgi:hypothetical protein